MPSASWSPPSRGRRQVVHPQADDYANERVIFDRPIGKNQGIQFPIAKAYAQTAAAELMLRESAACSRPGQTCGEDANMAKLLSRRGLLGGGEVHADAWRLRLCRGVRRRAQIPRGPALADGADLHQPDPVLHRRARARAAAVLLSAAAGILASQADGAVQPHLPGPPGSVIPNFELPRTAAKAPVVPIVYHDAAAAVHGPPGLG